VPPVTPSPPAPPPEKSVDDLLTELERVQAQKAELEKKEQELKATLRKKLEQQTERLQKLGVGPKAAKPAGSGPTGHLNIEDVLTDGGSRIGLVTSPRTQHIIIDQVVTTGIADTERKLILDAIGAEPGQVFLYPVVLDEMRNRLEKAGFRSATVEVLGGGPDSPSKTLVVKLPDPKK
jgi:hypothetical protein